jgi:hypothetical protein
MSVKIERHAAIVYADGRIVQLSDVDCWNLGGGILAAVGYHAHPSIKDAYGELYARLCTPTFSVKPLEVER